MNVPSEVKLTYHARRRLDERKEENSYYNTRNLMRSSCKWYNRNDFIKNSDLYLHSLYVCRKSHQIGYITDGKIEVVYNKNSKNVITVLKLDEKFLPITKFIRPEIIEKHKIKKERKKLKKISNFECCSTTNQVLDANISSSIDDENINMTLQELYSYAITELFENLEQINNKEQLNSEQNINNQVARNIVYRDKVSKPMTIKDLIN